MAELDEITKRHIRDIDSSMTWKQMPTEEVRILAVIFSEADQRDRVFSLPIHNAFFSSTYAKAVWMICKDLHQQKKMDLSLVFVEMQRHEMVFVRAAWGEIQAFHPYPIPNDAVILDWCFRRRAEVLSSSFSLNLAAYGRERALEIDKDRQAELDIAKPDINFQTMDDQIQSQLEYQEKIEKAGGLEGYRTFDLFDEAFGGLIPGDLITIGARPGGFKTGLAINLALQVVKMNPDVKACFINLEMPSHQMVPRFVQATMGITKSMFNSWPRTKQLEAMNSVFYHKRLISTKPMHVDGDQLVGVMRGYYKIGFRVFFIDYLQLIRSKQNFGVRDDLRIQDAINKLKEFKDESPGVHICCMAQLTRGSELKARPTMADLAGSSYIEAASAMVLINNPKKDSESSKYSGPEMMNGTIVKNRHGRVGDFGMTIDKAQMRVLDTKEAQQWARERKNND